MSFVISNIVGPDYLMVTATGEYSFERLWDFISTVKAEADKVSMDRVLIDCRSVRGEMCELERFDAGKRIAEVFGFGLKAVLMMESHKITKLGELAAVNRGARLLVTSSETEAIQWLLDDAQL